MDYKKALQGNSRKSMDKIVSYIGEDQGRFNELLELFLGGEYRLAQKASWPLGICAEKNPTLIRPYLKKLLDNLNRPVHSAVKRNTIRILQFIDIPEKHLAQVAEICFHYLATPSEPIAVRVFSMTVLMNITKKEPDFKNELKILIEDQLPFASAAFISRAKKVLKELEKLNGQR